MSTKISEDKLALADLYLDYLLIDKTKINSINQAVAGMNRNIVTRGGVVRDGNEIDYAVFKKLVDFEKPCDASAILSKYLKGTGFQSEAIKYMAASPLMAKSKKYKCGDEDLELLLR